MTAFATSTELADYLQVELDPAMSRAAELLLDLATSDIQQWVHAQVEQIVDDVVTLPGNWTRQLLLPQWPVTAVTSVVLDGVTLTHATQYTWQRQGVLWRPRGLGDLTTSYWGGPDVEVVVTYTHGYATIPGDVKLACLEHAAWRLANPDGELTRLQIGDVVEQLALGPDRGVTATSWRRHLRDRRRAATARTRMAA